MKSHFLQLFTLKKLDVSNEVTNHCIGVQLNTECRLKKPIMGSLGVHHGLFDHNGLFYLELS